MSVIILCSSASNTRIATDKSALSLSLSAGGKLAFLFCLPEIAQKEEAILVSGPDPPFGFRISLHSLGQNTHPSCYAASGEQDFTSFLTSEKRTLGDLCHITQLIRKITSVMLSNYIP
ncbi:hypothetical protein ILYODFUR_014542 [Ilyodon furcidens]|uniref:Uncharacterized protein n=1 Tax=Ilyodon furcidens TaxID=33524 RepID=A0ABV0URZ4_9TELE